MTTLTLRDGTRGDPNCPVCKGKGWASQWREYGHQESHGFYYEKCRRCAEAKRLAAEAANGGSNHGER